MSDDRDPPPNEPAGAQRSRRRRWPWVVGVLLALAAWGAISAKTLLDAKRAADRGLDELREAQADLGAADLLRGAGRDRFEVARTHFRSAHDHASSPILVPLRYVPFVGRQVRSVERMTGAADATLEIGIDALDATQRAVDDTEPVGRGRITLARELGEIATRASADLDAIDLGPDEHLYGPLQDARDRFGEEFADLSGAVEDLAAAGDGLSRFLEGPSRYLVLAANNSEMRMGAGAFLSAGVMTVRDGRFELGPMEATEDLVLEPGTVPITDEDFAARWAIAEPTDDFRELSTTSRFDVVGAHALAMWEAKKGERLDGVLVIDPIALRALLKLTGPVVVDGTEYSADNVVNEIFLQQYRALEDQGSDAQIARRDRLSRIARAAIDALERGGWDAVDLLDALRPAVAGRHVLAFGRDAVEQRGWQGAGLGGDTERDSIMLGLQNRAGNKLDQFIVADAKLFGVDKEGPNVEMTIELTLANVAPDDLPRYVEGPYPTTPRAKAGKYQGWVTVELPAFAQDNYIEVAGERVPLVATGRDGDSHRVVAALVEFERGENIQVTVHFEVGDVDETLYINPSARYPVTQWTAGDETFDDSRGHRVRLGEISPK
jgi:Protein of unknown function (DUF4012)